LDELLRQQIDACCERSLDDSLLVGRQVWLDEAFGDGVNFNLCGCTCNNDEASAGFVRYAIAMTSSLANERDEDLIVNNERESLSATGRRLSIL
jgi:hypothetical protein